jgi:branched-chain amino acid transport system substrate-binding protein
MGTCMQRVVTLIAAAGLVGALLTTAAASPAGAAKTGGSTILVGAINETTGSCLPSPNQDVPNTLNAWQKWVNGHGGILGHPVKVMQYNDNCDPAQSAADAQKLISAHVLAIFDSTEQDTAWAAAAASAHIPVICATQTGNGLTCFGNANFFPVGATVIGGLYGNVLAAKQAGAKSFTTIYCTEVAACAQAIPLLKGFTTSLGMTWATPLAASETASSYTAQCVTLQQEKVSAIFPAGPPSGTVASDCAQQGYHPIVTQSAGTWQNSFLKVSALNGSVGTTSDIPWTVHNAATKTFDQATGNLVHTAYSPFYISVTWAAGLVFETALKNSGATANPTAASVYQGLYAMNDDTMGGFTPPLTYVQGKPTDVSCFFTVGIKHGAFVAPNGAKYQCQPSSSS